MAFSFEKIVPWGRSFEEYVDMFSLSSQDLQGWILGCGDGPASFNAAMNQAGGKALSVDPLYRLSVQEIEKRISETYHDVLRQLAESRDEYVWDNISSPEELGRVRMAAMKEFLNDFPVGRGEGRYVDEELPGLSFVENQFDLALCSHLLFLYSEHLDLDFHLASIVELCRVAREVRIFPLVDLAGVTSRHLPAVQSYLDSQEIHNTVETVPYEFQRGGNQMLKIICPA